jgi:integration host factor subunit alpha
MMAHTSRADIQARREAAAPGEAPRQAANSFPLQTERRGVHTFERVSAALAGTRSLRDNEIDRRTKEARMTTITKADLATLLHENLGVNKREAAEIVMAFFEEISTELERGETVKLSGFGVFCLRNKNSRPGRNPKTGEMIPVSARRVVMFHPSHILKALVQRERPVESRPKSAAAAIQAKPLQLEEYPVPG